MNQFEQIDRAAVARGLPFLLIGGFAVIQHGFARLTEDLDLMVARESAAAWREMLASLGYRLFHEEQNFIQFTPPTAGERPLDLMLANVTTFAGLLDAAITARMQGVELRVVSLDHLLALKLHVLKQGRLHRFLKDFEDVAQLVRLNNLDLNSPRWHGLFLRYGNAELLDKIQRASRAD